jgi:hypothetical protein
MELAKGLNLIGILEDFDLIIVEYGSISIENAPVHSFSGFIY